MPYEPYYTVRPRRPRDGLPRKLALLLAAFLGVMAIGVYAAITFALS